MLLILITVGVPGCLTGAAARSSSTAPRSSAAETERPTAPPPSPGARWNPGSAEPAGQAAVAPSRTPGFAEQAAEPAPYPEPGSYAEPEPDAGPESPATRPRAAKLPDTAADPAEPTGHTRAAPPPAAPDELPPGYRRSLAYSGLLGLVISVIGLAMVGSRRRLW
ncbi:hypothetical protein EF879_01035 [Micromonospora sp. HM5-17]|jgi:hypothetical protein|nr:hypothetical protein EF879_01035 [Micromonospora sp. HM5-17]